MSDRSQEIAIFEGENGEIAVTLQQGKVWLNQAQLAGLFAKNKRTISEHIRNLFKEGELEQSAVVRNFRTTASDGKSYDTQHGNLDVIISVGYRVKSLQDGSLWGWGSRDGLQPKRLLAGVVAATGGDSETLAMTSNETVWNWRVGSPPAKVDFSPQ
ncbi:hypothetical protein [Craterilacuibacter sp.]|uniref:hypothetical protein n=1 Tax=Craterilacuibacter sp. TaxID=2870909 RepID=UPI003F3CA03B